MLVIGGDLKELAFLGAGFVVLAFVVAMLANWRRGLYLFLVWLFFEDFARKYLGNNMVIYFAKDFLVAVVYLSFFIAWRRGRATGFRPPFLVPLLLFVWFGIIQIFNPGSSHIMYGLLGTKLFFYYIPLMMVGYALIDSEAELRRFFFINLGVILIVGGLGIAQSILGPTFLNPAVIQEDIRELSTGYRVAPISRAIAYRPTSVFVSGGRYADFVDLSWLMLLGFLGYMLLRQKHGRTWVFLGVSTMAAAAVLTASRGVFLWAIIGAIAFSIAFLWGAPWRQGQAVRVLRTIQRAALGIALAMAILMATFPDALFDRLAIYSETLSPDSPASELMHRARDYPLQNLMAAFGYERWPYGYGIGTTSLGTQYVARIFGARPTVLGVESGYGTLIVELGIGGLILWLVLTISMVVSAWNVVRKLRGSPWFPIGFAIFWFALVLLFPFTFGGMQPYQDFLLNAYLWLLFGILYRLPNLKASAEFAATAQVIKQPRRRWII